MTANGVKTWNVESVFLWRGVRPVSAAALPAGLGPAAGSVCLQPQGLRECSVEGIPHTERTHGDGDDKVRRGRSQGRGGTK